ncbi:HAD-IIA family hydrolase [Aestuariicoccus sp. KMU-90]|uniref:HAD-IIA family hydrolase n=2 Tax=Thetidibacter halocola TaxID=2827239 RepID=A0A8J8B848_9RHOB|nr:HAD-IIA family hydrolase [Thetidibacter halocola]
MLPLAEAWARYEAIRDRLPAAGAPGRTRQVAGLLDVADEFDGFLFDSFGVLNVGETAIPGAAECLTALRRMGKRIRILTNAASYTGDAALAKYRRMNLDVARDEIVSSRDVTLAHLGSVAQGLRWGAIAAEDDCFADAVGHAMVDLLDPGVSWDAVEGFVFLSSARWTVPLQDRLAEALMRRPRPAVIGNPDLVAPREGGLTVEPGFWAHDLQDRTGIVPRFFGKPYPEAFEIALSDMGPGRYAMIGDTLHTDILGGQAAGLATILVTDHGLFAGQDTAPFIAASGIVPDIALPSI